MTAISFACRLTDLAVADPDRLAITCGSDRITRAGFEAAANSLARRYREEGVSGGAMVTIALPNSVAWFVAVAAAWKIGAIPQPISSRLPGPEIAAIVELAGPALVVGEAGDVLADLDTPNLRAGDVLVPGIDDSSALEDVVSPAWKAPTSGGSTGRPKLIVSGDPALIDPEGARPLFIEPDGCMVMPAPLYHNGPIVWSCQALLWGCHVVVLQRFDPEATLAAIEEHGADIIYLVPTMMRRIWRLPEDIRTKYDLSSLRIVWHLAEPCPEWLKQAWIDWLGAERIVELYAGTEAQAATIITGPEWLAHRGSVGKVYAGEIRILDSDGVELPAGEQGEVWLRQSSERATPTYRYIGADAKTRDGGWESLGDMGWLDTDGYLYLGDRVTDMILTGGANVYPAEVESALCEHPAVRSCAVIGLPDEDRGQRVHAIVEADHGAVTAEELLASCSERIAAYKVPRTVEFVDEPLRDDAGKVRRTALRAARVSI